MVRRAGFTLLLLLWIGSPVAGQEWARKMFETTRHDFGTVARNAKAEYQFVFTNIWMEDVHVSGTRASCGCTSVSVINPLLKTYQRGAIVAKFNTDKFLGSRGATLTVTFDKPFPATVQLQVSGNIRSDVVVDPAGIILGDVDQGTPVSRTVTVTRSGRPGWKILDVRSSSPHISGKVVDTRSDGYRVRSTLEIQLDGETPIGYLRDQLILTTNDPNWSSVPIQVDGRVIPAISVSPASLFLGVLRPGQSATKQVVVRSKSPFGVTGASIDGDRVRLETPAPEAAKPLHVLPLTFIAGDEPGKVEGKVRIGTDVEGAAPEVTVMAVVER